MSDPICSICREPKSKHVATDKGPFTHPREASGEGAYVLKREAYIAGGYAPGVEYDIPAVYEFRVNPPAEQEPVDG